jgi:endonuclease VIII
MPEGDTIFKAARTLHRALAGQTVTRFETVLVHLARVDADTPVGGRTVERVAAAGKHVLMTFSGGLVLRTHMRMNGSWHIYRPGERWQAPRGEMRIAIETTDWVAVAFRVHVAEFIQASDLARHRPIASLGPDLLADTFDADEALRRMRIRPAEPIADVLLDQRVFAGIGNVYKSEVLFLAGIHPDAQIAAIGDDSLREVIGIARRLLLANVVEKPGPSMVTYRGLRRTTGRMRPADRLWVYSRGGRPCRKCGTPIAFQKTGDDARVTYWCPTCQQIPTSRA